MSVRISGIGVIVKRPIIESRFRGGIEQYGAETPGCLSVDEELVAVCFDSPSEVTRCAERLRRGGIGPTEFAIVDARDPSSPEMQWLEYDPSSGEAWVRGHDRGAPHESAPYRRFDLLSRSTSGLNYVRERKGGLMRVLTESELADFNDPPPCPRCAEQFGCEHFNCAGEPLLAEHQIEEQVPERWRGLAREYGISRTDLERLEVLERSRQGYHLRAGAQSDMRTLELLLLLNEE